MVFCHCPYHVTIYILVIAFYYMICMLLMELIRDELVVLVLNCTISVSNLDVKGLEVVSFRKQGFIHGL